MTTKSILRQIRVLFRAVLIGMVLITLGALALVLRQGAFADLSPVQIANIQSVVLLCVLAGIPGAHYYHRRKTKNISADLSLENKLLLFKTSFVVKIIVFEGLCMLGLLVYLLTASHTYIIIASLCIVALLINYPSKVRIADDLSIDPEELNAEN